MDSLWQVLPLWPFCLSMGGSLSYHTLLITAMQEFQGGIFVNLSFLSVFFFLSNIDLLFIYPGTFFMQKAPCVMVLNEVHEGKIIQIK